MTNEHEKHIVHYLILFIGLIFFGFGFVYFKHSKETELFITAATSVFYVLWGIIHHAVENRLTRFIALEYVLFGSLIFFLLFTVILL